MKKLFWGFFFIFIYFHLDFDAVRIGLIPTFVGYLLLLGGISELLTESTRFEKVRIPSVIMAIYTGILYVCDFFGLGIEMSVYISIILGLVFCVLSYYISYHIVEGVIEIETQNSYPLDAARLKTAWIVLVVTHAASYVAAYVNLGVVAVAGLLVMLVCLICFLCFFRHSQNCYYRMKEEQAQKRSGPDAGTDTFHSDIPE